MSEAPPPTRAARPILVTLSSLWGLLSAFLLLFSLLVPTAREAILSDTLAQHAALFAPFVTVNVVLMLTAAAGFWSMRRWGVYLYVVELLFGHSGVFLLNLHIPVSLADYVLQLAALVVGIVYFRRMR